MTPAQFDEWLQLGKSESCIYYTGNLGDARMITLCIRERTDLAKPYSYYTGTKGLMTAALGQDTTEQFFSRAIGLDAIRAISDTAEELGRRAWKGYSVGLLELVQRQHEDGKGYDYIAQRRKRPAYER